MNFFSDASSSDSARDENPSALVQSLKEMERKHHNRRSFLRGSMTTAAVAPLAMLAGSTSSQANNNFLPSLYRNQNALEFEAIMAHENAHVEFLVTALGSYARPKPSFQNLAQPNLVAFANTAKALENTGVGAYLAAAPIIYNSAYLAAAGSILTIEARHAGYLNVLLDLIMTANVYGTVQSFETPLTIDQVVTNASPFISSLNGGPPLTFSTTPSAANDVAILNFALALEYLEAAFYDLNVPNFV